MFMLQTLLRPQQDTSPACRFRISRVLPDQEVKQREATKITGCAQSEVSKRCRSWKRAVNEKPSGNAVKRMIGEALAVAVIYTCIMKKTHIHV